MQLTYIKNPTVPQGRNTCGVFDYSYTENFNMKAQAG